MKLASLEAIVNVLNAAGVQFLVVGGVAVDAHGYLRYTKDLVDIAKLEKIAELRRHDTGA